MKKLTTLLIVFCSLTCNAWQPDKTKHLIAGAVIAAGTTCTVYHFTGNKKTAVVSGIAASIAVSAAKELIYDKALGKGNPEWADFGAGVIGATVSIPLKLTLK